ncbi:hypothetical protein EYF80_044246 [Liparis tanakae]|uniref:Uncharacterized protein n=1 Tax=Liparis tanakae TaxID=230148 RepID=A0A4Z2FXA6_9TELE|nr:hypothetical protein EYF80_044246 [Liparis tanakae]
MHLPSATLSRYCLLSYTCFTPYILCQSSPCLLSDCCLWPSLVLRLPCLSGTWILCLPLLDHVFCETFYSLKSAFFVISYCVPACLSASEPHPITKMCQLWSNKTSTEMSPLSALRSNNTSTEMSPLSALRSNKTSTEMRPLSALRSNKTSTEMSPLSALRSNKTSTEMSPLSALRSNKTSTEMSPLSAAIRRSFVIFTSAVSVLWCFLNPD